MTSEFRLGAVFAALLLGACGGGSSDGDTAGDAGDTVDKPAACTATGGEGYFSQVADAAGMCSDISEDVPLQNMHFMGGGLAMSDYNNDGQLDLYVAYGRNTRGQLYTFNGATFEAVPGNAGINPPGLDLAGYFVDIDGDGWEDFISIQYRDVDVEVFRNNGDGTFTEDTASTGILVDKGTFSMAATDYDLDGDVDLFFAHWGRVWQGNPATNYLYQNDGNGNFTDVSDIVEIIPSWRPPDRAFLGEHSFTPVFADVNGDAYPDLFLVGDFEGTQLLINNSGVSFTDATTDVITDENGMGNAVGDYDLDGDFDWFVSSIYNLSTDSKDYLGGESGNRLYRNDAGTFVDVTDQAGVRRGAWGWGSCFADFDNDGHLDIFQTAGMEQVGSDYDDPNDPLAAFLRDPSRLFMSNGDGTFTASEDLYRLGHTGQGRGILCTDYDADGRVDVLIANNGGVPSVFRNELETGNYIQVELRGPAGNRTAVGAKVTVNTPAGSYVQQLQLGQNYLSQEPRFLHFGLGEATTVSSITVVWPDAAQTVTQLLDVAAGQRVEMAHPSAP